MFAGLILVAVDQFQDFNGGSLESGAIAIQSGLVIGFAVSVIDAFVILREEHLTDAVGGIQRQFILRFLKNGDMRRVLRLARLMRLDGIIVRPIP